MGHIHLGYDIFGARAVPVSCTIFLCMAGRMIDLGLDTFSSSLTSGYGVGVSMQGRNRRCSIALREDVMAEELGLVISTCRLV